MKQLKWKTWKRKADSIHPTHDQHVKDQWHWFKDASTPEEWGAESKRNRFDILHIKMKCQ